MKDSRVPRKTQHISDIEVNDEVKVNTKPVSSFKNKAIKWAKTFVGLSIIVIFTTIFGAIIFYFIEGSSENTMINEVSKFYPVTFLYVCATLLLNDVYVNI